SELLRGADIVVIPDHDDPGYAHADAIVDMSAGIAKRIRVLKLAEHWPECPKGGDISDWLAAGHTREELDALISRAREVTGDDGAQQKPREQQQASTAEAKMGDPNENETPWPILNEVALHGLAGDVVHTIEPHTEADPVAILLQYLISFGNAIGRGPYY